MKSDFLERYLESFGSIEGWFEPEAALMFMAYAQLLAAAGVAGAVLEIGVHRGLSAIAVASLRGEGRPFYAVDLFEELQSENVSHSGLGNKAAFLRNMARFYDDTRFIRPVAAVSRDLQPEDLGSGFSFCHIDGGHSVDETRHDLELSYRLLVPGGLLALDDYFNPAFPGVCEGSLAFRRRNEVALLPIAIGFNKVLFQKLPAPFDLNAAFSEAFPDVPKRPVQMWERTAFLFAPGFRESIDVASSVPGRLVPRPDLRIRAILEPQAKEVTAPRGGTVDLAVRVTNESFMTLRQGALPIGLTYHLLDSGNEMVRFDNPRTFFADPIPPGDQQMVNVSVRAPEEPGDYRLELDLVWEGYLWFKDRGSPTSFVDMAVT